MKSVLIGVLALAGTFLGITPFAAAAPSTGHLATIQDQARATRESFIRAQIGTPAKEETVGPNPAASSTARLVLLEDRLASLKEKAIFLNYERIISRLWSYQTHLENILSRLDRRLADEESAGRDMTAARQETERARASLATASTTIALVAASTTEAFLTADTATFLSDIKLRLTEVAKNLELARLSIMEAITAVKNSAA